MKIADYVNALPDSYKKHSQSNNYKLLLLEQEFVAKLMNDIDEVQNTLDLFSASGKTLDLYGQMYGVPRGTAIDEQYRFLISQKVAQNMVTGDYNSIINAIAVAFDVPITSFQFRETGTPCEVEVLNLPYGILLNAGMTVEQMEDIINGLFPIGISLAPLNLSGTFEFGKETYVVFSTGKVISLTDSDQDTLRGLNVYGKTEQAVTTGKQLLNNGKIGESNTSSGGITFTANQDGSVTINGTATAESYWIIDEKNPIVYTETSLIATIEGAVEGVGLVIGYHGADNTTVNSIAQLSQEPDTFEYPSDAVTTRTFLYVSSGKTITNVTVYPMIRLASISDDTYEPYTGGITSPNPNYPQELVKVENPTITICSGNLCNNVWTSGAIDSQGTFVSSSAVCSDYVPIPVNAILFIKRSVTSKYINLRFYDKDKNFIGIGSETTIELIEGVSLGNPISSTSDSCKIKIIDANIAYMRINDYSNDASTKYFIGLYDGEVTDPYVEPQSLTIPYTLHGIPVTSGGNCTDSTGQMWITDEIDFERGVYIQRTVLYNISTEYEVKEWVGSSSVVGVTIYGLPYLNDESNTAFGYCSHFKLGRNGTSVSGIVGIRLLGDSYRFYFPNTDTLTTLEEWTTFFDQQLANGTPVQLLLIAAESIETPLTDEELEAYRALYTYDPTTVIYNDADANMKVFYISRAKSPEYDEDAGFGDIDQTVGGYLGYLAN